jgi:hypothetical protein
MRSFLPTFGCYLPELDGTPNASSPVDGRLWIAPAFRESIPFQVINGSVRGPLPWRTRRRLERLVRTAVQQPLEASR